MGKILIIEDDQVTVALIKKCLSDEHLLTFKHTVADGKDQIQAGVFDLFVFDLMLPDGEGFELLQTIQRHPEKQETPVIILSSKTETPFQLMGYSYGADDYITKPFNSAIFKAKVESKISKFKKNRNLNDQIIFENLKIVPLEQRVYVELNDGHRLIELTGIEFKLLMCLITPPERVRSRTELIERAWGLGVNIVNRTVDTHISHLRKKIKDADLSIESMRGEGYRITRVKRL